MLAEPTGCEAVRRAERLLATANVVARRETLDCVQMTSRAALRPMRQGNPECEATNLHAGRDLRLTRAVQSGVGQVLRRVLDAVFVGRERVTPMVVWGEPEHPLETAADSPRKRPERRSGGFLRRRSEPEVREQRERPTGMTERKSGRLHRAPVGPLGHDGGRAVSPVACGLVTSSAHAQSAGTWNKRGQAAEAREDYDAAFEAYRQAWLKKPKDLRYKERYERLRFQDANQHVDRGRVLRQSGDVGGAINEFARALQIDPGNQAAAQELEITQRPASRQRRARGGPRLAGCAAGINNKALSNAGPEAQVLVPGVDEETPHQREVQRDIDSLSGPVKLQPVSNDPITLHMVEDTKIIYQAIGKAAGLNVIFDPKYHVAAHSSGPDECLAV